LSFCAIQCCCAADSTRRAVFGAVGAALTLDLGVTTEKSDRFGLRAFFLATGGTSWKKSTGWGTSAPLGEWYGVTVAQ